MYVLYVRYKAMSVSVPSNYKNNGKGSEESCTVYLLYCASTASIIIAVDWKCAKFKFK